MFETMALSVNYGGVRALSDVSIAVETGELVGLIGANGAGKTTFIDAATGFTPSRGRVRIDGREISDLPPHKRVRAGLVRTWQAGELFEDLSVLDNVRVAVELMRSVDIFRDIFRIHRTPRSSAYEVLGMLGLDDVSTQRPNDLPQGRRKLVGVARALASHPTTILLDEPAAGLSSTEGRLLGSVLRRVATSGVGLLLVEHDVDLVLSVSDRVYVLEGGVLLASGSPDEIRKNPDVIRAYLGEGNAARTQAGEQ